MCLWKNVEYGIFGKHLNMSDRIPIYRKDSKFYVEPEYMKFVGVKMKNFGVRSQKSVKI